MLPPHCPVCLGLRTHAHDCPERYDPEEPEEDREMFSMYQIHPDGPIVVKVVATDDGSGKGYLELTCHGTTLIIHRRTPKLLQDLALEIAKAGQKLAAINEQRLAKEPPQDVPFQADVVEGFKVQEVIPHREPSSYGPPVEQPEDYADVSMTDTGNPVA